MKRTVSRVVCAALLLIVGSAPAQADYKDSYKKGIQAYNGKRWAEAVEQFNKAITEQPLDTGDRINISGLDFSPYAPHFYLGMALKNQKDCSGALEAWKPTNEESLRRWVRKNELDEFARSRGECEVLARRQAPREPRSNPSGPADSTLAGRGTVSPATETGANPGVATSGATAGTSVGTNAADAARNGAPTSGTTTVPPTSANGAAADRTPSANPSSTFANSPPPARANPVDPAAVTAASERAREALRQALEAASVVALLGDDVRKLRESVWREPELGPAQTSARHITESAASKLTQGVGRQDLNLLEEAVGLSTTAITQYSAIRQRARSRLAELQGEFKELRDAPVARGRSTPPSGSGAPGAPNPAPRARPTVASNAGSAAVAVPKELSRAAQLFFDGNYVEARRQLANATFADGRVAAQAHLFRAASAYTIYLRSGETDRPLLDEAIKEVALSRESDPLLKLNSRSFSPRFQDFYARSVAQAAREKGSAASK